VNLVQITPGAGGMYCGNCFRDNALVAELRRRGHQTLMLPLYLPMTLDEADQSAGAPVFFSGVNVYLEQKSALLRHMPSWLHRWLASPAILRWAAGRAAKTCAADVGDLTLSMMRGEEGNQARELVELTAWLKAHHHPDVICLSNALLVGLVHKLKAELGAPVVITLQGEDTFLDALPQPQRDEAWKLLSERAREVDLFIAPSRYYSELMSRRLNLPPGRVRVIYNGISLDGFGETQNSLRETRGDAPPVLGYFARMCREKGLLLAVETFVELRRRGRVPRLRLHIGGGCGPSDAPVVAEAKALLEKAGLLSDVAFFPNVDREMKLKFFQSLTVFCTPALYGEAFGLYVIEALAAGVPVVQPRHAAFPELIEATGGGLIREPNPAALADGLETLLLDPPKARELGASGQRAVRERFSIGAMADATLRLYEELTGRPC
jgi:glycosyltransferase involved in cell wall biosynthesis